uniref:Uncharacterized protein n=1 Tax=Marseillevirus LCMAC103 TaxID=2506604 RepID=A0A481YW72_9VIRU|nr:MAG: hypothetical protein LCMAC103_03590 [Marseillevirus LCMAC103]
MYSLLDGKEHAPPQNLANHICITNLRSEAVWVELRSPPALDCPVKFSVAPNTAVVPDDDGKAALASVFAGRREILHNVAVKPGIPLVVG